MSWRPVAAAAVLGALALWTGLSLAHLREESGAYRRVAAEAAAPRLAIASGQLIAPTPDRARAELTQRIGDAGAGTGARLSLTPLANADAISGVVALHVVARGDEARLLRFSAHVEQGPAVLRWSRWSIVTDGAGGLRLTADAVAPWRPR